MKYFIAILFILCSYFAIGQNKNQKGTTPHNLISKDTIKTSMHLIARNYGDSIVIRWAPDDATAWLLLKNSGYQLQRKVFTKNEKNVYTLVDSSTHIMLPWKVENWADYFKASNDTFAAVAAQIMFGKTLKLDDGKDGTSLNNLFDKYDEQQNRFGFALLIADFDAAVANGLGFRFVEKNIRKDRYYLFSVLPVQDNIIIISDTARTLVNGSELYKKDTAYSLTAIGGDRVIDLFWINNPLLRSYSGYFIERSEDGKIFTRLNRLPFVPSVKEPEKPVRFTDSVTENYKKYYYRIFGVTAFGDLSYPSPAILASGQDLKGPVAPEIVSIKNIDGTQQIHLKWEKKEKEYDFKGYIIGRSNNLADPYEPVSDGFLPFNVNEFTDNNAIGGMPNYYIVAAIDTAGNASNSMPVYMNVNDYSPPEKPTGLAGNIDSVGRVAIHWNWGQESDLAGYKLFFSNAPDHEYTPLTGDLYPDTLYTDSIVIKTLTKKIYYKVIAYDKSMNPSEASDILVLNKPDIVPPVQAIIHDFLVTDSNVVIKWYPSPSQDAAIQRLLRKTEKEENWELLKEMKINDSLYFDKQTAPQTTYHYAVETIDSSGLSSGKSFPVQVFTYRKNDNGVIKNFHVTIVKDQKSFLLKWTPPKEAVSYYILYRQKDNSALKLHGNISGEKQDYEEEASPGLYQFAIKAVYPNGAQSALSEIKTIQIQ